MRRPILLFLASCGGSSSPLDDLPAATLGSDATEAKSWAQQSAPNAFMFGQLPAISADLVIQANNSTCPTKTVSGSTTTYTGECTDANGQNWVGTATETAAGIHYDGFGWTGKSDCMDALEDVRFDGGMTIATGSSGFRFTVDVTWAGTLVDKTSCAPHIGSGGTEYSGRMEQGGPDADGDGSPDQTTWNGSGRVGTSDQGVVDVTTTDELLDDQICNGEALSGQTTIASDGHAIAITYDGATDCDADSTVRWSLDGQDQGELTGVSCSTGNASGGVLLVGAVLVALRRRRHSPVTRRSS